MLWKRLWRTGLVKRPEHDRADVLIAGVVTLG